MLKESIHVRGVIPKDLINNNNKNYVKKDLNLDNINPDLSKTTLQDKSLSTGNLNNNKKKKNFKVERNLNIFENKDLSLKRDPDRSNNNIF